MSPTMMAASNKPKIFRSRTAKYSSSNKNYDCNNSKEDDCNYKDSKSKDKYMRYKKEYSQMPTGRSMTTNKKEDGPNY